MKPMGHDPQEILDFSYGGAEQPLPGAFALLMERDLGRVE